MAKGTVELRNTILSLLLTFATMASGFVIPRLTLLTFGSEVNGLVSSLQQYLNYVVLVEGGLGGVVMASLYKPILMNDEAKISRIAKTVESFYRKIALGFVVYVLVLAIVYPRIVHTTLSYHFVSLLAIILAISSFVQYFFAITNKIILNASKRVYITAAVQIVCVLLNLVLFVVCIRVLPNIHLIKAITALVYLIQPLAYKKYVDKLYHIETDVSGDTDLIKRRWDGFGINVASFIHGNTDVVLLSLVLGLKSVSVYTVYFMIVNAIRTIITSVSGSLQPSIGELVARGDKENLLKKYNSFEMLMTFISFVMFSCCTLLIVPFVRIYTHGVDDISYIEPAFAVVLCVAEMIFCIREPSSILIYSSNMFREIRKYAYIEATLNICISLALLFKMGLIGVAVGTLVSIAFRHIAQIVFLSKRIISRSISYYAKVIIVFSVGFLINMFVGHLYIERISVSYINWFLWAVFTTSLSIIVFGLLMYLFFRDEFMGMISLLRRKEKRYVK